MDLGDDFALPDEFSLDEEAPEEEDIAGLPEFGEDDFSLPDFEEEGEEDEGVGEEEQEISEEAGEESPFEEEMDFESEVGPPEGEEEELELPEEELGGEEFEVDEFSIDDLGQDFGVLEEREQISGLEEGGGEAAEEVEGAEEVEAGPIEISDDDFFALRNTLLTLPLNLKLLVEELIGEKGLSGENLQRLVRALADGKSPKEIAQLVSKITGRRVEIPSQYAKRTGAEFEEEKGSLSYVLRYTVLPIVRTAVLAGAALALLIFFSYRYVYQPVYAYYLYDKGYEELEDRNYQEANTYFSRAREHWKMKGQYFRYAEGYREQEQWILAEGKYERLLEDFPKAKKAYLDYAQMELDKLANYERAVDVLDRYLSIEPEDYDALLLLGDTYLEWGKEDADKYEEARLRYARLMDLYGVKNELLFRMLKYFIRTDNMRQVDALKRRFEADQSIEVDPEAYAELGGYLLDKGQIADVQDILLRANEQAPYLPEVHYHLARYFRRMEEHGDEKRALNATLAYLKNIRPLSSERLALKIDTHRLLGERLYAEEKYLEARASYNEGKRVFEDALERRILERGEQFGRLYKDIGDLHYYIGGNMDQAMDNFLEAERNSYSPQDLKYKKGYIHYGRKNYREALLEFDRAAGDFSNNKNLVYSSANTLYRRKNYHSADGYYRHLLEMLERKLEQEQPLELDVRRDHRELVFNLMRASNNLGVALYKLHEKTGRTEYSSEAMVEFSDSSEYFDIVTRDPRTLERVGLSNLGYLNQRAVTFPQEDYSLQIYPDIPMDMESERLR